MDHWLLAPSTANYADAKLRMSVEHHFLFIQIRMLFFVESMNSAPCTQLMPRTICQMHLRRKNEWRRTIRYNYSACSTSFISAPCKHAQTIYILYSIISILHITKSFRKTFVQFNWPLFCCCYLSWSFEQCIDLF